MASLANPGATGNYLIVCDPAGLPDNRLLITTAISLTEAQILAILEILRTDYAAFVQAVGYDTTNNSFFTQTTAASSPT